MFNLYNIFYIKILMKESILIASILIFIYIFIFLNQNNLVYVEANTGTNYLVQNSKNKKEKANLLAKVMNNLYVLKNYLVNNISSFQGYEPYIKQLKRNFVRLYSIES